MNPIGIPIGICFGIAIGMPGGPIMIISQAILWSIVFCMVFN